MVAATPALDGRELGDGLIIVPYGLGVFGAGMAAAMLAKNEEDKALDVCMRLKGYVIARLTRKELGEFRERLRPAEQDAYIDNLIKSGRLAEGDAAACVRSAASRGRFAVAPPTGQPAP